MQLPIVVVPELLTSQDKNSCPPDTGINPIQMCSADAAVPPRHVLHPVVTHRGTLTGGGGLVKIR